MRRWPVLSVVMGLTVLAACAGFHENDRQLIGPADASFPLPDGLNAYLYGRPTVSDRDAAFLSESEIEAITSTRFVPVSAPDGEVGAFALSRAGHCYRVQSELGQYADLTGYFYAFHHLSGSLYLVSASESCAEAGHQETTGFGLVDVSDSEVRLLSISGFDDWAGGLNGVQRWWYGVQVRESADPAKKDEVVVTDLRAYRAFAETLPPEQTASRNWSVLFSTRAPTAEEQDAARLLAKAERLRDEARRSVEPSTLPPVSAEPRSK